MARGRKKEIFEISFNKELTEQVSVFSTKQLILLLIAILTILPQEAFINAEFKKEFGKIFSFFGNCIRNEVEKNLDDGRTEGNSWEKAANASAIKTFENSSYYVKKFITGLSRDEKILNTAICGNLVDTMSKLAKPDYISDVGFRDGLLMMLASKCKAAYDYFSRSSAARPLYR